ncbi:hypothetical protein HZ994_04095 [Akkermansiaceae bacterium]|nr:hypothetical protein HZ994_04095 [Akkermansiaceae bacterium]
MRKTAQYLFLVLGCLHLVGGPYALIQAYAWANMILAYSQDGPIGDAVADTFSGQKPCSLCKKIEAAKESDTKENRENKPLALSSAKPFQDLFPPSTVALKGRFPAPYACPVFAAPGDPSSLPATGPPAPPPRC